MCNFQKVAILDQNKHFETGLNSLINWSKYHFQLYKPGFNFQKPTTFTHFSGVILCDEEILSTSDDSFIDFLRLRPDHMKLILTTLKEDIRGLKKALKVKADWILEKPIDIQQLHNILGHIKSEPEEVTVNEGVSPSFNIKKLKTYAFNNSSNIHNLKKLKQETLFLENGYFLINILYQNSQKHPLFEFIQSIHRLSKVYFEPNFQMISLYEDYRSIYYILYTESRGSEEDLLYQLQQQSEELVELVNKNMGISINISISTMGSALEDLPNLVTLSQNSIKKTFYRGYGHIIRTKMSKTPIKSPLLNSSKIDTLIQQTKTGSTTDIPGIIKDIKGDILEDYDSNTLKEEFAELLVHIYSQEIRSLDSRSIRYGSYIHQLFELETIDEIFGFLEEHLKSVSQRIFDSINVNNNLIINKVLNHIDSNYNEPITLESVAKNCYISSSYLSRIFKKIVGENFNEYLTNLRLLNAKRLLLETNYKTYQIAEKVGIYDSNYFSRLFKKNEHMTPSQFRDRNLA